MSEIKWIKLAADVFDNRKIRQIEALPDGDSVIIIWFKILCLAGNINDNGLVYFTEDVPYTEEMLATAFNRPLNIVRLALQTFEQFKMIEVVDDIIRVSNWDRYQNIAGMERVREQTRARVAKHREQKKLECNVTCNVTERYSNATDIEEDIDIEKEKEIYKEKEKPNGFSKKKAAAPVHAYGRNKNVLLTDDQYKKIQERFPQDWEMKLDNFSDGIATKNYGYKNHYLALLRWHDMEVERAAAKWMSKAQAKKLIVDNNLKMTVTEVLEQVVERKGAGFV